MTERIIERLIKDIFADEYFEKLFIKASRLCACTLLNLLEESESLSETEFTHLLRFADILSNSDNSIARNKAYQIISLLNDTYRDDPIYRTYSKAVFAKLGNFPAIEYLQEKNNNNAELPFDRHFEKIIKETIQSVPEKEGLIFTDTQYKLFTELSDSNFFSFSGPTSMGKSFIIKSFIRKVISNKTPENLIILVPTRALINQFAFELKEELNETLKKYNYKIITNSSISELSVNLSNNYIFVLTPERLISYLSQKTKPSIGFIFVDEAHKIAAETDIRSVTSYVAIEKTLKTYPQVNLYFASPNVSNPEIFLSFFKKEKKNFFHTIESPVSQNLFLIDLLDRTLTQYIDKKPDISKPKILDQINKTNDIIVYLGKDANNIIYCNSKTSTIEKALEFYEQLNRYKYKNNDEIRKAIRQIKDFIHKDYYLATLLEAGIAYHFGNLPQIIRTIIESLYRNGNIQYMFCTSTLLEGVNLPAKNIFILVNKKGPYKFTQIDFWNLAGRAGRLRKELSGNIFCIRDKEKHWKNTDILESSEEIKLKPTVVSKTDTDKNLKRIESLILKGEVKVDSSTEKDILEYIANIICIDTMKIESDYQSPVIKLLIDKNKDEIIERAKRKTNDFEIPLSILDSNQIIKLSIQNNVFNILTKMKSNPLKIKLPNKIDYDECLAVLNNFYELYDWKTTEVKDFKTKESLKYYALLMTKWINGTNLNQIISDSLDYQSSNSKPIYINHTYQGIFDIKNKYHINKIITDTIEDIEQVLRFTLEKYFNHYFQILIELLGEKNAGSNWAQYLEYGTRDNIVIALQNLGISRHTSNYIVRFHENCLIFENDKLRSIDSQRLLRELDSQTIEYDEVKHFL